MKINELYQDQNKMGTHRYDEHRMQRKSSHLTVPSSSMFDEIWELDKVTVEL